MKNKLLHRAIHFAVAAVCLGSMIGGATAGSFTRGCATRDMQILMLLEQRESANAVSAQKLTDAIDAMTHARMVCDEGRVGDAFALYDTIAQGLDGMTAQGLASDPVVTGRIR